MEVGSAAHRLHLLTLWLGCEHSSSDCILFTDRRGEVYLCQINHDVSDHSNEIDALTHILGMREDDASDEESWVVCIVTCTPADDRDEMVAD